MAQRATHNDFPGLISVFPAGELGEIYRLGKFQKDTVAQLAAVYLRHGQIGANPAALTVSADANILPLLETHLETLNHYAQNEGCVTAQLTPLPPELLRSVADRRGVRRSALPAPGSQAEQLRSSVRHRPHNKP